MAKRILCVSLAEDSIQYLEVEKQPGGFFPLSPPAIITDDTLKSACRKADEIHINTLFPATLYERGVFPKVAKRYVAGLVEQDAKGKPGVSPPFSVRHKIVGEVIESGVAKRQVAYIVVEESSVASVWSKFKGFAKKVKSIAPLPVVLASAISRIDTPAENFVIIWAGKSSSIIAISDPEGTVRIARSIPLGLPEKDLPDNPDYPSQFSRELDKEVAMTLTFYKQQFRESVPGVIYIIGNSRLEGIFQEHPLSSAEFETHFGFARSPVSGMTENETNENINLIGSLFPSDAFNFIPGGELAARKIRTGFTAAYAALAVIIVLAGFWCLHLNSKLSDKIETYDNKLARFQDVAQQVEVLRGDVERLKPFEGWKLFYESTFKNQPGWNMFLSELGLIVPADIVIENFQVVPEKGAPGFVWSSRMAGKVRAENWQKGLDILRRFGGKLQASPFFEVTNIQYAPEKVDSRSKIFDFKVALKLLHEENADES